MYLLILLLKILSAIFFSILIILLLILFIPFKYETDLYIKEKLTAKASLIWIFGLFKIQFLKDSKNSFVKFYIAGLCVFSKVLQEKTEESAFFKWLEKSKMNKKHMGFSIVKILFEYFNEIISIVKPKSVLVEGVYGFYDPSVTGLMAAIAPILTVPCKFCRVNLNPSFEEEVLDVKAEVFGGFFVFNILFRSLGLFFKIKVRKFKTINNN